MQLLFPTLTPWACLCFVANADAAARIVRRAQPGDYLVAVIGVLGLRTAQVPIVRRPRPGGGSAYAGLRRTRHGVRTFLSAVRVRWSGAEPLKGLTS
jgi:hypothetical protein